MLLEAGISNYLNQTEKYSNGSNEGPIYSTIDPAAEDLRSFSAQYSQHTTPYASTPIMPFTNQTPCSPDQDGGHWINQPGTSSVQYAQPDRSKADNGTYYTKINAFISWSYFLCEYFVTIFTDNGKWFFL